MYTSIRIFAVLVFLMISSLDSVAQEPPASDKTNQEVNDQQIEVFYLSHAHVKDVAKTISGVMHDAKGLAIVVDERLNALLVRSESGSKELRRIRELLDVLDIDQPREQQKFMNTLPLNAPNPRELLEALRGLELRDVEAALIPDGVLLLKGEQESVKAAKEMIEIIEQNMLQSTQDVSVEVVWLTESKVEGAESIAGNLAEQLTQRGFKPLSILGELEVNASVGRPSRASGAAKGGSLSIEVLLTKSGKDFSMELELKARSEDATDEQSGIEFSSSLTTPLDRFVVFGVAQRKSNAKHGAGHYRDLFLIRLKKREILTP